MRRFWRWLRLGATAFFGYRLRSGNRVRVYVASEEGSVVASFLYQPSVNDELDMKSWLHARAPFLIDYSQKKQHVTESIGF